MRPLVKQGIKAEKNNRVAVLRLEVDYELAILFEALKQNDETKIELSKRKLEQLRKEWIRFLEKNHTKNEPG
ncbi:hypothetical protein HOO54_09355 [Bacillus sp. WMMC1349]|uniref:hypothetical protein n=1 Tax=Bacillus sp. WMMC1349 TaxID=2736254 RepID=UPI00155590C6|nr:hypothetical protein [Bacillus sp. WMMC1349]NPC92426.1 hypothetical protein [Bacillus sp. WMMC1349]